MGLRGKRLMNARSTPSRKYSRRSKRSEIGSMHIHEHTIVLLLLDYYTTYAQFCIDFAVCPESPTHSLSRQGAPQPSTTSVRNRRKHGQTRLLRPTRGPSTAVRRHVVQRNPTRPLQTAPTTVVTRCHGLGGSSISLGPDYPVVTD